MAIIVALVIAVFSYDKIPFIKGTSDYSAYFAEAGGIKSGSDVRVSGLGVGRVSGISLEGTKVLRRLHRARRRRPRRPHRGGHQDRNRARHKDLELTPRGDGSLNGPIPLERTRSPYDLPTRWAI